jgi:hypothetical protein
MSCKSSVGGAQRTSRTTPHFLQRRTVAAVIPGDSLVEETVIMGTVNFLRSDIIGVVLTVRHIHLVTTY